MQPILTSCLLKINNFPSLFCIGVVGKIKCYCNEYNFNNSNHQLKQFLSFLTKHYENFNNQRTKRTSPHVLFGSKDALILIVIAIGLTVFASSGCQFGIPCHFLFILGMGLTLNQRILRPIGLNRPWASSLFYYLQSVRE